jgi:hypothetical protein
MRGDSDNDQSDQSDAGTGREVDGDEDANEMQNKCGGDHGEGVQGGDEVRDDGKGMREVGEEEDRMRNGKDVKDARNDLEDGGREMGMRMMTRELGLVKLKRKVMEIKDRDRTF